MESLSLGHPVWVFCAAPLHHPVLEMMTMGHARGVLDRKPTQTLTGLKQITLNHHGLQRGLNTYSTFKHWPPPTNLLKITLSLLYSTVQHTY